MRRFGFFSLLCIVACTAANATDREFKDVVRAISDEFHTQPLRIPFFGLVNVVAYVARPAGTRHIDLAVFENLDSHDRAGRDISQSIRNAVGAAWKPFITVVSRRGGHEESVFMYMRVEGRECKVLIATVEPREATVIELKVNPEALQRWIQSPREYALHHRNHDTDVAMRNRQVDNDR